MELKQKIISLIDERIDANDKTVEALRENTFELENIISQGAELDVEKMIAENKVLIATLQDDKTFLLKIKDEIIKLNSIKK